MKVPANIKQVVKESLRDWFKKEKWVRISSSGNIAGDCGTSKNKKNPDRCLPKAKAQSLTKGQRAATAAKKKKAGSKGKTVVKNTKKATVKKESKYHKEETIQQTIDRLKARIDDPNDGGNVPFLVQKLKDLEKSLVKKEGLWANINAKKKAGKKSSHKNSNAYKDAKKAGTSLEKTKEGVTKEDLRNLVVGMVHETTNENTIMEKDDRCTRLAKSKYDTWPSAYASGAVVRCRRGEIWKKK